jgi:hypothetical protein
LAALAIDRPQQPGGREMSEDRPVYIPCASGNQLMTDLMIRRCGDLVEIVGHPIMHLTPGDALYAAETIRGIANLALSGETAKNADLEAE